MSKGLTVVEKEKELVSSRRALSNFFRIRLSRPLFRSSRESARARESLFLSRDFWQAFSTGSLQDNGRLTMVVSDGARGPLQLSLEPLADDGVVRMRIVEIGRETPRWEPTDILLNGGASSRSHLCWGGTDANERSVSSGDSLSTQTVSLSLLSREREKERERKRERER